jgi:DNA invertase Pin-like site-specific DNA recombinase
MQYISYLRVSSAKQGATGLGIEAQRTAVKNLASNGELITEYVEVESGKNDLRPKLAQALAECRKTGATLLIAKLDRLSRSVKFLFELRDSGVNLRAADVPEFNTMTLGILAVMAQYEREKIAERTQAALTEKRKQIGEWRTGRRKNGNPCFDADARAKATDVIKAKSRANTNTKRAKAMVASLMQQDGGMSFTAIAEMLNANGFATATGKTFNRFSVMRLA